MLYPVTVTETLSRTVWVDAETPSQAEDVVCDLYDHCEIVLDSSDFDDNREIEFDPEVSDWMDPEDGSCYDNEGKSIEALLDKDKVIITDENGCKMFVKEGETTAKPFKAYKNS